MCHGRMRRSVRRPSICHRRRGHSLQTVLRNKLALRRLLPLNKLVPARLLVDCKTLDVLLLLGQKLTAQLLVLLSNHLNALGDKLLH